MEHREYMRYAITLARRGGGFTLPNPQVGAVIVKDGRIIGEGYHKKCGELHAERNAFASLKESAVGADMYVTLEPCCHYGRTPPCTEAILEHGISRVFIGSRDPNPLVSGKGASQLREQGVVVVEDFCRKECDELNPVFFHYITTGLPYVAMKYAMTLDGKIAAYTGASQWITGEKAREHVHALRGFYSAIVAGIGTVLADNPLLNCRLEHSHQPVRVVVDSHLRIPTDSRLCRTARYFPLLIACAVDHPEKQAALEALGAEVVCLPGDDGRVDLTALLRLLEQKQLAGVLIEGGGTLNEAFLRTGQVNHLYAYIAPKLMGGKDAKTPVEGCGAPSPDGCAMLENLRLTDFGGDILLEYDVKGGLTDVHGNH